MPAMKRVSKGRSKLGCATCKKRRIKCDEGLPSCSNCLQKAFPCEGIRHTLFVPSSTAPTPKAEQSHASPICKREPSPSGVQLALQPARSAREMRAFHFWTESSCPGLANWTDQNFFRKLLPRVAMADEATWYALIAASTLLEHPAPKRSERNRFMQDDLTIGWHRQALEWYGCSLKAAKKLPTSSSTLLRTFLYGAVEMLQDRPDIGLQLIHRSLILNEAANATSDADWEILSATLPMLTRSLVPLSMFGLPVTASQRARARRPSRLKQSTTIYATLLDHMEEVHNLIYEIQIFCNAPGSSNAAANDLTQQAHLHLLHRMSTLSTALESLKATTTAEPRRFLAQLLVLHSTYQIKLLTHASPTLLCYDAHEHLFRALLAEATRVLAVVDIIDNLFAWEIATVPCLYYTAWACRRPSVRRKAIELLRDYGPRQEHLWSAESALGRMERVVCWEEGRAVYEATVREGEDAVLPGVERRLPMGVAGDPLGVVGTGFGGVLGMVGGEDGYVRGGFAEGENQFWNVARLMTREQQLGVVEEVKGGGLVSEGAV